MSNKYACRFMRECPDIKRLERLQRGGIVDEDLTEQRYELCDIGGHGCSLREDFLKKEKEYLEGEGI
jgi:hypothetical protein